MADTDLAKLSLQFFNLVELCREQFAIYTANPHYKDIIIAYE